MNKNLDNSKNRKKINILFISNFDNYFVDNTPSFYRMYKNLIYFYDLSDFNVIVLQPLKDKKKENIELKKKIICHYYRILSVFGNNLSNFLDFNPFFITKVIKILKKYKIDLIHFDYPFGVNILKLITKIPISYNAYNVESIFCQEVATQYHKIPKFLRNFYIKYIYFLEKRVVKNVENINAISRDDKEKFIEIYNIPENKILINKMGYKIQIFKNRLDKKKARNNLNISRDKFIVIFHGSYYNNIPNREAIHFIKDIIVPKIKDDEILFLIAGRLPQFEERHNLRFLGFIENLNEFLYSADIALVPIFKGSGVRIKMIDYLSARIPMITTKKAILGLEFRNKIHGYIIDERNKNFIMKMISKIIKLKNNPNKIEQFKHNIENLLKKDYNWKETLKNLELKYRKLTNSMNDSNS